MSRTLLFATAFCSIATAAGAQTPTGPAAAAPTHKHYEASRAGRAARPGRRAGAPAPVPRLAHVPGVDEERRRPGVHEPGPEPRLRLQPRRGPARLPRSGASRSHARDGLLGPGARARAQHQRDDGAERRAARRRAGEEGAVARRLGDPARAGADQGARRTATRARPNTATPTTRPTRTPCGPCTRSSPTTPTSRCSTSSR